MRKTAALSLTIVFFVGRLLAQAPIRAEKTNADSLRHFQHLTAILGAFPAEVALIHNLIQHTQEHTIQHIHFTEGTLNGRHVVLAQTGIGKVNAAITTTLLIEHFQPSEVLFTGIAGGVDPELSPGDLVIGSTVAYHDYGTITPDSMLRRSTKNPFTMQDNPLYFPSDVKLIAIAQQQSMQKGFKSVSTSNQSRLPKIVTGTIVTGDVFVSSVAETKLLHSKMNAEATEMEGAAVAQACWQQKVPFLVIRSLSDNAGNHASADVAAFYQTAAYNSANLVIAIVAKLN